MYVLLYKTNTGEHAYAVCDSSGFGCTRDELEKEIARKCGVSLLSNEICGHSYISAIDSKSQLAHSIGIEWLQADECNDEPTYHSIPSFEDAKNQFTSRFTMEHKPDWAMKQRSCGGYYAPQYSTDREWYDNLVLENGYMRSTNCTFPLGERLDSEYMPE